MAVIIGGGSSLKSSTFLRDGQGVVSVNFDLQANVERLWQLGSFSPYETTTTKQRTMNVTVYGIRPDNKGGTNIHMLPPSTSCADATSFAIEFNAVVCQTGGSASFRDIFFVNSYSYSKDFQSYGQESWSLQTKPIVDNYAGTIYMLRGIATGRILKPASGILTEAEVGCVIDDAASRDSLGNYIESESGSITAGFPGIGNYDITREVVVANIGGSTGKKDGYKGTASATIPLTPMYL